MATTSAAGSNDEGAGFLDVDDFDLSALAAPFSMEYTKLAGAFPYEPGLQAWST